MLRTSYRTANPYEASFGYSRAVRRGASIFVSGTTSIHPSTGELQHPNSAYDQARVIFEEIFTAIRAVGGHVPKDVARVRMYVRRAEDGGDVAKAMKEALDGTEDVAATMICGVGFVQEEMLVEIEVDAVCDCPA